MAKGGSAHRGAVLAAALAGLLFGFETRQVALEDMDAALAATRS